MFTAAFWEEKMADKWVTMWGNSMSCDKFSPSNYAKNITLRYIFKSTIIGKKVRIKFSNSYGYENVKLNEAEVDQVFTVPLEWFMHNDPEVHIVDLKQFNRADFPFEKAHISPDYKWRSSNAEVPIYNYEDKAIWGLTARITRNMVQILKGEKK